jgi:hypothetical protein
MPQAETTALGQHTTAPDPHPGIYATQAELDTHAGTPHGGSHPDLATHDALGLATQAELDTHAGTPHGGSSPRASISLGGYVVVTNVGASYDAVALSKGLGVAEVDFTGCAQLDLAVRVNKIGTGTQSWQLWDETAAAELMVVDDAAAAGERTLTASKTSALPTGVKRVRIRAKSTVATDDPVYYGASLRVS